MAFNPYVVLNLRRDASDQEIKRAYREQSRRWHPDKNLGNEEANEIFQEISRAYSILSDPKLRDIYDRKGERGLKAENERSNRPSFSTMWEAFLNMYKDNSNNLLPGHSNVDIKIYYDDFDPAFNVSLSISIDGLKQLVFGYFGVPVEKQVLTFGGKELINGKLSDYQIRNGSSVFLDTL